MPVAPVHRSLPPSMRSTVTVSLSGMRLALDVHEGQGLPPQNHNGVLLREILDQVAEFSKSPKAWGGNLSWQLTTHRSNACVQGVVPLLVGGAAKSGFQARLSARTDMTEREVYAQLELWCPEIEKYLHFDKVGWRPIRPHTNPPAAPAGLRGRTLLDRQYPFLLNRRLGIPGLLQTVTLVAEPLPDAL
jgi:hypothetical protein